ncbi:MAG: chloride channel protein [Anaerolineales bacterium]|jgi:chloride channel protein, CIC family
MKKQQRILLDSVILGIVGGLSAQLFTWLLHLFNDLFMEKLAGYIPPGLPEEGGVLRETIGIHGLWLIPLATTLGGLIAGILVYSLAPEAEGHGTDTAVKAFHRTGGFIRARVAPLKMLASAITIGSGGAAGREGPTALISAGVGSIYGTLTKRSDEERRTLLLIGMASGLSAIFRSPIGTAFFAVEVLYSGMEFDAWVLLYTLLGSIVAYTVNGLFVGWQPLFNVPVNIAAPDFMGYLWYAALGVIAGLGGILLPEIFYKVRDLFKKIPIPPHFKPAIGGLGVGIIALALPQVLGGGYGWIQEAIDGKIAFSLLAILMFAKIIALALTISSGGSGGVFAPSLFIGAMLGGAVAKIFHQPDAAFVIVGMAAVFAGAARVPIATLLMVTEMTGGYKLLVPAALAITVGYVVQKEFSAKLNLKYFTLYEGQVEGRPDSPAHQVEHLETAIQLLAKRQVTIPETISHVDLRTLLETGIPIDLPGNRRLVIRPVKEDSSYVGKSVQECCPTENEEEVDLVVVFRGKQIIFPHEQTYLKAGDRLLLIASYSALEVDEEQQHESR